MIDEDVLRDLLSEAADAAPPPGRPADELLEAVRSEPAEQGSRRTPARVFATAAGIAIILGGALALAAPWSDGPTSTPSNEAATDRTSSPAATVAPPAPQSVAGGTAAAATGSSSSADSLSGAGSGSPGAASAPAAPSGPAAITDTARVVKTGSVDLEIDAGNLGGAMQRITATAIGLGGYVAESSSSESADVPTGAITVRVPAAAFDQLIDAVREMGTPRSVSSKGVDVTAQFTDLDARLTALTTTRDRLHEVLREARNVGDIIAVQDRITGVQTEIEQLQGQRRLLDDQASFGTVSITLGPADHIVAAKPDAGFRHAFEVARHRFANSVQGLIAWAGGAALAIMLAVAGTAIAWYVWRRQRRRFI